MGTKHPDQVSTEIWRDAAETVGRMYEKHWEITAHCRTCQLVLLVDLRVMILIKGPGFSLWNQRTRCRRIAYPGRCQGWVEFSFKAPGMTDAKRLFASDRRPDHRMGRIERAFYEERQRRLASFKDPGRDGRASDRDDEAR